MNMSSSEMVELINASNITLQMNSLGLLCSLVKAGVS